MGLGAVIHKRSDRRPKMCIDREEQAIVFASVPEPLERRHRRERIHAEPAILGRHRQALNTEATALFPSVVVKNAVAVVVDYIVLELLAGEAANGVQ